MIPGIGWMKMDIQNVTLAVITGKELRAAIRGIRDTDRVYALVIPVSEKLTATIGLVHGDWERTIPKKEKGGEINAT